MGYADRDQLYQKFAVTYADGQPVQGPWFVLCYARDPHARAALATYADSCQRELPGLAAQIRAELDRLDRQGPAR